LQPAEKVRLIRSFIKVSLYYSTLSLWACLVVIAKLTEMISKTARH